MRTQKVIGLLILILTLTYGISATAKEVALTIDDLPYVGNARDNPGKLRRQNKRFLKILNTLQAEDVPAAGFVVPGSIDHGQWELLEKFKQAGNIIANHSFSHQSLNRISADQFIEDIKKADEVIAPLMSTPKYFRYPFLATGRNCATYLKVKRYLENNGYVIVPVTIDTKDFKLNHRFHQVPWRQRRANLGYFRHEYLNKINHSIHQAERKTQKREGRPVRQIVLIHMNTLNAYFLKDMIQLFREQGYRFVSLPRVMEDPYYEHFNSRCN
ncbi:MAG: polysaccharide deacetylase family protein [Gammaproteobacteria bacterium]|nr:polysaccharide deacetylase family protein [Gammaproteobacteria bacterium]